MIAWWLAGSDESDPQPRQERAGQETSDAGQCRSSSTAGFLSNTRHGDAAKMAVMFFDRRETREV